MELFRRTLPERDSDLFFGPPADSPDYVRVFRAFDDFILHQFAEFGWRMLMSRDVLQRISEWEKHDPRLLERMGKELGLRSRVLRGEKSAELRPDIDIFADKAIEQLGRLLSLQRIEFGKRPGTPTCSRIAAWMRLEVEGSPADFPDLAPELEQLVGSVESLPRINPKAARGLEARGIRPQGFFYQWFATCTNRSVKDVQNEIAKRRRQRGAAR